MGGIAHEEHAMAAPLRRHAMMNAVDDGVENFHLVDGTDEANDLRAELGGRGLGDSGGERIKETPAMRRDQDHPDGLIASEFFTGDAMSGMPGAARTCLGCARYLVP